MANTRKIAALRSQIAGKLNLEMSTADEMVAIALHTRPDQVTLVPERADEITTEGGLDLETQLDRVREVAEELSGAGIVVSLFLDPDPRQIEFLAGLGGVVPGFEINTDAYTRAEPGQQPSELEKVRRAADLGVEADLKIYAGHGLTTDNVAPISRLAPVEELNIGHSIVSRSVLVGMDAAVREMLAAMSESADV